MSLAADRRLSRRQRRAARGSARDVAMRSLKGLLPLGAGAVAAVMLFAPFRAREEIGFLLDKTKVALAGERLRVEEASYRGADAKGRAFVLTADRAIQRSSTDPRIRMTGLDASLAFAEGPARLSAADAVYDPKADRVVAPGAIRFATADGYALDTGAVAVDLRARTLAGDGGVSGRLPIGTFRADRIRADLDARVVALEGDARLTIRQGAL